MSAAAVFRGGCQCGAVRFAVTSPTKWCAHCHCHMCQRAHGAAFVTWVGVEQGQVETIDHEALRWYESSPGARRGFCGRCGSTLFFESERWAGETHIVRANFDGEIDRTPGGDAFAEGRPDWSPYEPES